MKKILIGYDGSPCADAAIEDLHHAGLPAEDDAVVISVAEVWLPWNPANLEPSFPDTIPRSVRVTREHALQAVEAARALAAGACERLRGLHPGWKIKAEAWAD